MKPGTYKDFKAVEFLELQGDFIDANTKSDIQAGKLQLEDARVYWKKLIHGSSGILNIADETTAKKVGTFSLDKSMLKPREHMIVQGIRVGYKRHASATDPALVIFTNTLADCTDTAVLGAELSIIQNGRKVCGPFLVRDLFNEALPQSPSGVEGNAFWLSNWRLLEAEKLITVQFEFASGQTVGTGTTQQEHIFVELVGQKLRLK